MNSDAATPAAVPVAPSGMSRALALCQRVTGAAGWEILGLDLDLTQSHPTVEIKLMRADGRWLSARADSIGRCTLEVFHRARSLGMSAHGKGRRPLVPQVEDAFLGRHKYAGPRAMLRGMTAYLADNALHPVALSELRAPWAALMAGPVRMRGPTSGNEAGGEVVREARQRRLDGSPRL